MSSVARRISSLIIKVCMYILLLDFAYVFIFPFLYMIVTSLKSNTDLYDFTVNWVPKSLTYGNYLIAASVLEYSKFFMNSIIITVLPTIGHLVSCSLIGYGFARYNFPGKKILFFFVLVALIVPIQTIIVPLYMTYVRFNWRNTFYPFIVPTFFGFGLKGALFIYLFKQYYSGLPKELEEAAYIDGCGHFMTYLKIVLPLAQTIFIVTIVLSIVWHWNDFYEPSLYISKAELTLLPARLNALIDAVNNPPEDLLDLAGDTAINEAVLTAGTVMIIMPVIIVFSFLQKKFVQGIERAGLTGE